MKAIVWENMEVDVVKKSRQFGFQDEAKILDILGYLRGNLIIESGDNYFNAKNKYYLLLKKIPGINMDDFFISLEHQKMALSDDAKYEIGLQAAASIAQLHKMGILHHDIKPGNFMINVVETSVATISPTISAIDFGTSMVLEKGETEKEVIGAWGITPKYAPPEVYSISKYSKKSDIYSLGIMFKEDLKLSELGKEFADLVNDMILQDADKRPTIEEVVSKLNELKLSSNLSEEPRPHF